MISSTTNIQVKEILKLQKSARERKKKQIFVAEGEKLAAEAAFYGRLEKIYLSVGLYGKKSRHIEELLHKHDFEVVEDSVFRSLSETVTPQGILGLVRMPSYELEEILADDRKAFLVLDDIRDPGNLGTILRTAEGAGMAGVILSRESVDLFNPKVVRSTMGSIFRIPFFYADDLTMVIETLRANCIPVYGTMMQGSQVYDRVDYRNGAAIVIGNEANGISQRVAEHLTGTVRIPMAGSLESLNAAVSAAILVYEIARQRRM
ncbi:MAG: RNA methyltransferase [Clostridiaceae bacterium]|nr:RNA methyltransferase [Clostridiaceae bacterium]